MSKRVSNKKGRGRKKYARQMQKATYKYEAESEIKTAKDLVCTKPQNKWDKFHGPISGFVLIMMILAALVLASGCASAAGYERSNDVYYSTEDPAVKAEALKRIEHFERQADKAAAFYENIERCANNSKTMVLCTNGSRKGPPKRGGIDILVRTYRHDRQARCACVYKSALFREGF